MREFAELGEFVPGRTATLFDPLQLNNPVPKATLFHEMVHQELTRATTSGLLLEVLYPLGRRRVFVREAALVFKNQWRVQEGCATYAGFCVIAHHRPDYLAQAIAQLPAGGRGELPYDEAFGAIARVLPIPTSVPLERLQAQAVVAVALGHLSMNTDCLSRYADPASMNLANLRDYLVEASPNQRLARLLERCADNAAALTKTAEAAAGDNPVRAVLRELLLVTREFGEIVAFDDVQRQHALFRERWQAIVDRS